ncbi:P-type ATPase, cation transport [Pseudohyphozyma bogoriensis]|nr:P-type ATPase, cation transport [Pseudohyphozyma bogoriensis]
MAEPGPSSSSTPAAGQPGPSQLTTSILKQTSAYQQPQDGDDSRFFPEESIPPSASIPPPVTADPTEDDFDDPDGTMFSGPAAQSVPTSYSTFRMRARSRSDLDRMSRELSRSRGEQDDDDDRRSVKSGKSRRRRRASSSRSRRASDATTAASETDAGETSDDGRSTKSRRSKHRHQKRRSSSRAAVESSDEEDEDEGRKSGFFGSMFRGRRPSVARNDSSNSLGSRASSASRSRSRAGSTSRPRISKRRSTDGDDSDAVSLRSESEYGEGEDDDDPYGPYGSGDSVSTSTSQSTSSSQDDEGPRRRRTGGGFLGMPGAGDNFFGESRIDFDDHFSDDGLSDGGSPDRKRAGERTYQHLYIPDEDLPLRLKGLRINKGKLVLWTAGSVLSAGALWLLGRWMPGLWLKSVGEEGEFDKASYIVIETSHHPPQIIPIETLQLPRPLLLSAIFPPSLKTPPAHRADVSHPSYTDPDAEGSAVSLNLGLPAGEEAVAANGAAGIAGANGANGNGAKARKLKGVNVEQVKYIDYRYYRFLLHPEGEFRMVREWKDPTWKTLHSLRRGLTDLEVQVRATLFGSNVIEVASRGLVTLLMDEVLHPFYIFQIASIVLWSFDDYYYYAFAIAIISIVSIATTLIETRNNIERMREMSRFSCDVKILRNSEWLLTESSALIPGDVVDLSESSMHTFPADFVLLSGDAIVNESMLTGESVPVSKVPIEDATVPLISLSGGEVHPDLSRHVVFSGTKIVRVRKTTPPLGMGGSEPESLGMVMRTGFDTTKGALVRSMLFPKPFGFAFYRDSFRFIGVLALLAVMGFLASSVNFIKLGISWSVIIIRALDLITIVVPPALPATMSIGTSFAIARLRKVGIYCISPNRVNIGGKVNIVCFDKTGTLTEEGLDVLGVRSVVRSTNKFTELEHDADNVPIFGAEDAKTPLLHALATCHALKIVDGEVIGDPLDLRMFEFTNWTLEEGKEGTSRPSTDGKPKKPTTSKVPERAATLVQTVVRPPGGESFKLEDALKAGSKHAHFLELGVLRTFDFVSGLRRMSVLVKKLKSNSVEAYVKGAPEVMIDICDKSTLPDDYEEMLSYYTKHGFRVIALAGKSMPGLTWIKAQRLKREVVESDLRFLGLIIFENKLKAGTAPAIATFRSAHIPTRMVTGDNVRTAISVGRECGMIQPHCRIYLPSFLKGSSTTPRSVIEWVDVEDETRKLDSYSLKPVEPDDASMRSGYSAEEREYQLAVSGDVFRWMMDFGALETLQRMLIKGIIFARMSPDEKHELVERLQSLGYTVGFCGDGANDCGALKAADVGLSLSEAEASVAAPFTSRQPDIRCFLEVIKEGRAALVTSFSCFKFMALYSLIQFTTVTLLYYIASTLGDFQFLYIDLFLILPVAVTMGRTEAFTRIVPKRPTSSLISKKVLTSLIGQIIITSGVQFFTFFYVRSQEWYTPPVIDPDELDIVSYENTSLFLISSFQYILVAAVFCVGPPYRKPLYTNRWLLLAFTGLCAFSLFTLFTTTGPIFSLLQLISLPHEFHLELLLLLIANVTLSFGFEAYGAEVFAKMVGDVAKRIRRARGGRRRDDGKEYKRIARAMDD